VLTYPEENVYLQEAKTEVQEGQFMVTAPRGHGIMVVVQYLQMRTQFRGLSRQNIEEFCRDHITIWDANNSTEEICGLVYKKDNSLKPIKLRGPRAFYSETGTVTVKVHIDGRGEGHRSPNLDDQFQISFTATKDCDDYGSGDYYRPCFNASTSLKPGELPPVIPSGLCIPNDLFCDGVFQCGYDGTFTIIVGSDETILTCPNTLTAPILKPADARGSFMWIVIAVVVVAAIVMLVGYITSSQLACFRKDQSSSSTME